MRILVVCSEGCHRQFDASDLAPGSRFHCTCGQVLTVPLLAGFEAAVIRCSACGAPRQGNEAACRHCSASFTLVEQDLHTVCPSCLARVSDQARFCHHCSIPLTAEGVGGEATEHLCPACKEASPLVSRRLGEDGLSLLECHRCAGIWLGAEAFRLLEEKAQAAAVPRLPGPAASPLASASAVAAPRAEAVEYRKCPVCAQLMHRKNYGRRSGVIVDSCAQHGLWFDMEELARILRWVREGGLDREKALQAEELRAAAREARRKRFDDPPTPRDFDTTSWAVADFFADLFS